MTVAAALAPSRRAPFTPERVKADLV